MIKINKAKYLILSGLISTFLVTNCMIKSNANTVLPYKDVDGVSCVNIVELAKLKGEQVSEATHEVYGNGYNLTIDNKLITIYEKAPYIFIDGRMTSLKTEVISADGVEYNFPVMQTPAKEGDGFLIPMYVVEKSLGIKGSDEGIVIDTKEEVVEDSKEEDTSSNNTNSNNNNSSNNNSSNNNSSNNNTTNGNSSNSTGSNSNSSTSNNTNSGSTNNSGSTGNSSGNSNNGSSSSNSNNNTNNGSSSNSNGSNNGTVSKPETTPTPEPQPTPQPEQTPQATGMAFTTFASKLPGMGFDSDGSYWDNGQYMGGVRADSNGAYFGLMQNSATFNSVIKNCLNMLLPTGGNKVYNIVSNPFSNQTLTIDGRRVELKAYNNTAVINIYNQ